MATEVATVLTPVVSFAIYDGTGYILRRGMVSSILEISQQILNPGERILSVPYPLDPHVKYYVQDDKLVPCELIKPWISKTTVLANGVDDVRITDIPEGVSAMMVGKGFGLTPTVIDDGELHFIFNEPMKLTLILEKRPVYAQLVVEINAV